MKYKMLALDIDDTIVTEAGMEVSPKVYSALHKASEQLTITFVTARAINRFQQFLETLNLPKGYHVVENGAKVLDPQGNLEFDLSLPHDEVEEIINAAEPYYLEMGFLVDEYWKDDILTVGPENTVTGVSFTCSSETQAQLLEEAVNQLSHDYALYIGKHWTNPDEWKGILVFHKDATKGNGMRYIQKKLGIKPSETIAVGDGATDIHMFDAAGVKVAMGNAVPELINAADFVAPDVQDDGILEVFNTLVFAKSPEKKRS